MESNACLPLESSIHYKLLADGSILGYLQVAHIIGRDMKLDYLQASHTSSLGVTCNWNTCRLHTLHHWA